MALNWKDLIDGESEISEKPINELAKELIATQQAVEVHGGQIADLPSLVGTTQRDSIKNIVTTKNLLQFAQYVEGYKINADGSVTEDSRYNYYKTRLPTGVYTVNSAAFVYNITSGEVLLSASQANFTFALNEESEIAINSWGDYTKKLYSTEYTADEVEALGTYTLGENVLTPKIDEKTDKKIAEAEARSAKAVYVSKAVAEIGTIYAKSYVDSTGKLGASGSASATDYIPLDFDAKSEITARCSINGGWALVIFDKDYGVLLAIDGKNASDHGITASAEMQDVNVTLPEGAAYIRLTGSVPDEFSVKGNKSTYTENVVIDALPTIERVGARVEGVEKALPAVFPDDAKAALIGCLSKMAWITSNGADLLHKFVNALGLDLAIDVLLNWEINTSTGEIREIGAKRQTSDYIDVNGAASIESTIKDTVVKYVICCYDANKNYLGKALLASGSVHGIVVSTTRLYLLENTAYIRIMFCPNGNDTEADIPIGLYADKVFDISLFDAEENLTSLKCVLIETGVFSSDL